MGKGVAATRHLHEQKSVLFYLRQPVRQVNVILRSAVSSVLTVTLTKGKSRFNYYYSLATVTGM
jgi:hypothetical protein